MVDAEARFRTLRQVASPPAAAAVESLVREGADLELCHVNALEFARARGLVEREAVDAFVHAAKLGLFEMVWSLLCPGCGGRLDATPSLKGIHREYLCRLCAGSYEPTLDELVEVSFTVSPGVRKIAAHSPDELPIWDYYRHFYFGNAMNLPVGHDWDREAASYTLAAEELEPDARIVISTQLPRAFTILFEPVSHAATFLDVKGEPTRERQELTVIIGSAGATPAQVELRPGPLRLTIGNTTRRRILPGLFVADDRFHALFGQRHRFLTAKQLFTNQTFRELYRAETMAIEQKLKLTSLTVLFTDLKGSTSLYERVGDLVAYDMVQAHFHVLTDVVRVHSGAIVKTIGDAVMATFATPEHGFLAALEMRRAMARLNAQRAAEDLVLKIGMHEGPCLAVVVNDRIDYFGQTVNIAARVQGLADSGAIFATEPIVQNARVGELLALHSLAAVPQRALLKGIKDELTVYEIP
jgi:class 3 adenylate cyclase